MERELPQADFERISPFKETFDQLRELQVKIDEIPEAKACYNCAAPTIKTIVDYVYPIMHEGNTFVEVGKALPGYECTNIECGTVYYDPETDERFLLAVSEGLTRLGDTSLQDLLASRYSIPDDAVFTPFPNNIK